MQYRKARFVALENVSGETGPRRRAWSAACAVAVAAALVLVPAAGASAVDLPVTPDHDVQARMSAHVGTDGGVAAPDLGDCIRYGSAPSATTTGPIDNAGGTPGTEANAYSDGATGWVRFDSIAYAAHGDSDGAGCGPSALDLSRQSAVGFGPASVQAIEIGTPFALGRMVHRNNTLYTLTHAWSSGVLEVRFLGLELTFPWVLEETSNTQEPASHPANDDILQFTETVGDQTFTGSDGNEYTLVMSGFTTPQPDGSCAATLADPGAAVDEFVTVEQTSTTACLYASIRQIRPLTVVKIAEAAQEPTGIPAFSFTSTSDLAGSPWGEGFALTPTALGASGSASVTDRIVVGEAITIAEAAPVAPWSFTSLSCIDGLGDALAVTEGATITLSSAFEPAASLEAAPITCTYTNTDTTVVPEPTGSISIVKTVAPREGTPAAGYTGGSARVFPVDWSCAREGTVVAEDTALVTTGTPVTVDGLPVGAECVITGEDAAAVAGDFADDTYAWDGSTLTTASAVVTEGDSATLAITNHFVRDVGTGPTDPTDPVTPPGPLPLTDGGPSQPLALTGSGPILPFAFAGAGLLLLGALALLSVRAARRRH